jgi:hypothetical protein
VEGLATALDREGTLLVAVPLDSAYWTERAVARVDGFRAAAAGQRGVTRIALWVTGEVSPRFQSEVESRSIGLQTRAIEHLNTLAEGR